MRFLSSSLPIIRPIKIKRESVKFTKMKDPTNLSRYQNRRFTGNNPWSMHSINASPTMSWTCAMRSVHRAEGHRQRGLRNGKWLHAGVARGWVDAGFRIPIITSKAFMLEVSLIQSPRKQGIWVWMVSAWRVSRRACDQNLLITGSRYANR